MSGVSHQSKRRRPPKMYLVAIDHKVQDHLDGPIRLQRGYLCQEQEGAGDRNRGIHLWVKVIDHGFMVKIDKRHLLEVSPDIACLLEPVGDLEARFKLANKPHRLQRLAGLPLGSPVWLYWGQSGELAEAELRYRGPLTRGSSAVFFGVQLKGWAAGRGNSNGSYKGHQLFTCPEGCAMFVPASELTLRRSSRSGSTDDLDHGRDAHRSNQNQTGYHNHNHNHNHNYNQGQPPVNVLPRAAESVTTPSSPPPVQTGQRVYCVHNEAQHSGRVLFCGHLASRSAPGTYVGVLLDHPVGGWDGTYKGQRLCSIPSPEYGWLLHISKVFPETRSERSPPPNSKPSMKILPPPSTKVAVQPPSPPQPKPTPKSALLPPSATPQPKPLIQPAMLATVKAALQPPASSSPKTPLKPPPLPGPKPALKLPPVPPNKPQNAHSSSTNADHSQSSNGLAAPTSPPILEERAELHSDLEVGSMVEVNDPPIFGVIRWIGQINGIPELVAGIELDQELTAATDGSYLGERHFRCPANKGLFVKLRNCRRDSRFPVPEMPVNQVERCNSIAFAAWGSKRVDEHTPPLLGPEARELYQGWKKGIQGHLNSCYLDASLFSLFSCCSSVDWVLFWPGPHDGPHTQQAQDLLRCEIVNPLRRYGYVCASKTMTLRKLLEAETTDTGFTNEERDPEEFLNKLFQLLRVEPLLKIRSLRQEPQECHIYQLFPPSSAPSSPSPSPVSPSLSPISPIPTSPPGTGTMRVASVQALLESSFMHSGLKFTETPSCLPLLMPRFGKDFKMFDAILPSLTIDITDLLDETLRQCTICQSVAQWECLQCYEDMDITPGQLKQYCNTCNTQVHNHKNRQTHKPNKVNVPEGPWEGPMHGTRQRLALFAVTCIETSHYVSFVKYGPLPTDWLFFDSMADREGGENGFNVPQVKACPEVGRYLTLSEKELSRLDPASMKDTVRRLLCDPYMCLYHCPELSLYK
ncbi:ubiquitin carboxyl-terminal hydrolase CYLD [Chanos chanos]|uniref:ubiquitinyl hydrolase 1 n=1 Tax=Chanos chanos TaxID=29144 RepID=A0A6J2VRD1_CHACN|nr:ubiquitin carboxyl-terminal hydrolase CYLD-like [Chanos chanos]